MSIKFEPAVVAVAWQQVNRCEFNNCEGKFSLRHKAILFSDYPALVALPNGLFLRLAILEPAKVANSLKAGEVERRPFAKTLLHNNWEVSHEESLVSAMREDSLGEVITLEVKREVVSVFTLVFGTIMGATHLAMLCIALSDDLTSVHTNHAIAVRYLIRASVKHIAQVLAMHGLQKLKTDVVTTNQDLYQALLDVGFKIEARLENEISRNGNKEEMILMAMEI